jgi:beta-alanine--pyruvate transaminase
MLCGIDLSLKERPGMRGHEVQKALFEAGLHLKATGDTLLVAPPFVIEDEQLDEMASILRAVLSSG